MTVKAVTPAPDASNPAHPDHARWVKEKTLEMEVRHAQTVGGTFRDAETQNNAALIRLENRRARKRLSRQGRKREIAAQRKIAGREITRKELSDAGVTRRPASPILKPPPIAAVDRPWAFRIARIMELGRQGDRRAIQLALEVVAIKMAVSAKRDYKDAVGRELPFSRLRGASVHRAVRAGMEWVCERSIPLLGAWR